MSNELATTQDAAMLEKALIGGDLSKLSASERLSYYRSVCDSLGLNPLTRPFDYLVLNSKLTLYAKKDATEQLRSIKNVSVVIVAREVVDGVYVVTSRATMPDGRSDESIGAVFIEGLKGEAKANAMMKAETKSKRRVTLSIVGLGWLDETEVETIPGAKPMRVSMETGEILDEPPVRPGVFEEVSTPDPEADRQKRQQRRDLAAALRQARDQLQAKGVMPRPLSQSQVEAMTTEALQTELEQTAELLIPVGT